MVDPDYLTRILDILERRGYRLLTLGDTELKVVPVDAPWAAVDGDTDAPPPSPQQQAEDDMDTLLRSSGNLLRRRNGEPRQAG